MNPDETLMPSIWDPVKANQDFLQMIAQSDPLPPLPPMDIEKELADPDLSLSVSMEVDEPLPPSAPSRPPSPVLFTMTTRLSWFCEDCGERHKVNMDCPLSMLE